MIQSCCMLTVVLLAAADEPAPTLPPIERDFTVISPTKKAGQPLATLIPPASIARIVLTRSWTTGAPTAKPELTPEELIAHAFKSSTKGQNWGLLATERTGSEFILLTKKGEFYRMEVLYDSMRLKGASALLIYGKGFSCRYDLNLAKKDGLFKR